MTPYQRGCRDMLLKLEKTFLEAAEIEQLLFQGGDGAAQARASAYSRAAHQATVFSDVIPEDPEVDNGNNPIFRASSSGLYVVKLWNVPDQRWEKLHSKPFMEADALQFWRIRTNNGTQHTIDHHIDGYYVIFPAEES